MSRALNTHVSDFDWPSCEVVIDAPYCIGVTQNNFNFVVSLCQISSQTRGLRECGNALEWRIRRIGES